MFKKQDAKANILIVDDEPEITGLLFNLLSEDHECLRAGSAEDGLALLYAKEFDLVLTDIQMGGMSGLEFVSKLIDHAPDTVVIMISGLQTIETAITALRVGAFDYITKPFDLLHVEAAVRRALEHRGLRQAKRHYENYLEELVRQRTQEVKQALSSLEATYRSTLRALTTALDTRDSETHGHSERVVHFSLRLGRELGLESAEMAALEYGSLLHDIGKVGVPDAILLKPAGLTEDEWSQMRLHPLHGKQILEGVEFLKGASLVVEQHHEKWDGSGYPQGLAGEQIDLKARIFAVADTFDAIMSDRVYRKGNTYEEAAAELRRCAGTQFDPAVVAAFERVSAKEWDELRHSHTLSRGWRVKEDQAPLHKALTQDNAMAISSGRANLGGLRAA
ncbi:MAG TPA: HD domain-containing phosphohydrolase [Pyrinomonadaceae bacterium]|jgi:response regulator RpfG family c-di-GMP phosphodiesterase|nr:HD domain-containing phosphohydrolase [Pyrinomonadaceae bacterium]